MTPEQTSEPFIADDVNTTKLIDALETAETWGDLRESDIVLGFITTNIGDTPSPEFNSLKAYYDLIHSHLGLKNGALPANTVTLSDKFLALQSQILSTEPDSMITSRIVASLNNKLASQIASHEFLPPEQRNSSFWMIALQGKENEAGK